MLRQDPTGRSFWWAIGYLVRLPTYDVLIDGNRIVESGGQDVCAGGDAIVGINGKRVTSMSDLQAIISKAKPGATVNLTVLHNGTATRDKIAVQLGSQPTTAPPQPSTGCGH